jgi:S1-C subfamily serine protease
MQTGRSRNTWLVCGVIALILVCGGAAVLVGGMGLLAYIGGSATATPASSANLPQEQDKTPVVAAAQATPTLKGPVNTVSAGENAGIPYKAVVQIIAYVKLEGKVEPGWTGSGSIISPDGIILTNAHVVLSDRYYQVDHLVVALTVKPDQQPVQSYVAKILQADQKLDIAVIRVETDLEGNPVDRNKLNLPTVQMGDSEALDLGDPLTIIGYPSIGGATITLTKGEVAGFTAEPAYGSRAFIKTSANISGGNSGGLAANARGQIIGVPTQLGYGGDDQYVDCRVLVDTNRDGVIDDKDSCVPTGGFINALRPLSLALPYIDAAKRGEVSIKEGVQGKKGQSPTEEPSKIVFKDDFSDPNSGWDEDSWDAGEVKYAGGVYQVTVTKNNWMIWSTLSEEKGDLGISVDTQVLSPTSGGDYGVVCRYQDENNFYAMEVSEDGYFTIWKQENGEMVYIADWAASDAIPVNQALTIQAVCAGNRLMLGVNGTLLAEVTDDSFTSGEYGVVVGTYDQGDLKVGFDNFTVYEP